VWWGSTANCACLQPASRFQCGNIDGSDNTNKIKVFLKFLECYRTFSMLRNTNHVAYRNRQKKSQAYNELRKTLKQVETNTTKRTVVGKNQLCSLSISQSVEQIQRVEKIRSLSRRCLTTIAVVFQRTLVACSPGHS
jgi:hypothetical protein